MLIIVKWFLFVVNFVLRLQHLPPIVRISQVNNIKKTKTITLHQLCV